MIPQLIHYCWLSENPMPESIKKCIDSWHTVLPEYKIVHWNYELFPRGKSKWVDQAFDRKKYAFAADYIRLYALYHYGGIYLDCDVEVIKTFNDLLSLPYFIGQEKTPAGIEAATMGFEPHNSMIYDLLNRYTNRSFVTEKNETDEEPMPCIIRKYIASRYHYNVISEIKDFNYSENVINVFTADFFSPKHYASRKIEITSNTYSIHHFEGSWVEKKQPPSSTSEKKILKQTLFGFIRRHLIFKQNVNIISTKHISDIITHKLGVECINPVLNGVITETDCLKLLKKKDLLINDNIEFISPAESSNELMISDFYPIARIKDTTIEIHYPDYISREAVIDNWNNLCSQLKKRRNVFILPSGKKISKIRLIRVALLINAGTFSFSI